jgi:hypothetical protein
MAWVWFIWARIGRNEALPSTGKFLQKFRNYRLLVVDTL